MFLGLVRLKKLFSGFATRTTRNPVPLLVTGRQLCTSVCVADGCQMTDADLASVIWRSVKARRTVAARSMYSGVWRIADGSQPLFVMQHPSRTHRQWLLPAGGLIGWRMPGGPFGPPYSCTNYRTTIPHTRGMALKWFSSGPKWFEVGLDQKWSGGGPLPDHFRY